MEVSECPRLLSAVLSLRLGVYPGEPPLQRLTTFYQNADPQETGKPRLTVISPSPVAPNRKGALQVDELAAAPYFFTNAFRSSTAYRSQRQHSTSIFSAR
jgi:hypothetical protein